MQFPVQRQKRINVGVRGNAPGFFQVEFGLGSGGMLGLENGRAGVLMLQLLSLPLGFPREVSGAVV